MSIINQLKQAIDFSIFKATPQSWVDINNPHEWNNLIFSSEMNLCQMNINSIKSINKQPPKEGVEKLRELKRKIKDKIKELKNDLKEANGNVENDLKLRISELNSALIELDKLISTATKYKFVIDQTAPQLNYDPTTDTAIVRYNGTIGGLLNELKHAFQFETGQIDFIAVNNNGNTSIIPGLTYDLIDEVETYKRQYAYDGILKLTLELDEEEFNDLPLNEKLKNLGKTLNTTIEIKKMKKIKASVVVKISDGSLKFGLYKQIPKTSLSIHSSIGDIRKKNKNRNHFNLIDGLGLNNIDKKKPYIEFVKVYIEQNPYIYVK